MREIVIGIPEAFPGFTESDLVFIHGLSWTNGDTEVCFVPEVKYLSSRRDYSGCEGALVHVLPFYGLTSWNDGQFGGMTFDVHLNLTQDPTDFRTNLAQSDLERALLAIQPLHVSAHLGYDSPRVEKGPQMTDVAVVKPLPYNQLLERICTNIEVLQKLLRGCRVTAPLLLENLDGTPVAEGTEFQGIPVWAASHICCTPMFIFDVLRQTDCGLLLDFRHALVSAENLDYIFGDYLSELPLEAVGEVQLSGLGEQFVELFGRQLWSDADHPVLKEVDYEAFFNGMSGIASRLNHVKVWALEGNVPNPTGQLAATWSLAEKFMRG